MLGDALRSRRLDSCSSGARSPTESETTSGTNPCLIASTAVARMHPLVLTPTTVFSFYNLLGALPGNTALYGPEFGIYPPALAIQRANFIYGILYEWYTSSFPMTAVTPAYQALAADPAALVEAVPDLSVLATSRAPLRVRGETEYAVEPLEVDDLPDGSPSPAARLLLDRAQRVNPGWGADPADVVYRPKHALPPPRGDAP